MKLFQFKLCNTSLRDFEGECESIILISRCIVWAHNLWSKLRLTSESHSDCNKFQFEASLLKQQVPRISAFAARNENVIVMSKEARSEFVFISYLCYIRSECLCSYIQLCMYWPEAKQLPKARLLRRAFEEGRRCCSRGSFWKWKPTTNAASWETVLMKFKSLAKETFKLWYFTTSSSAGGIFCIIF